MSEWLAADEAARRLGVKPATLYAYVSRGQLRRRARPDGRRSEYHADDVADLAVRGRRARPVRPSDIVIPTAVTAITSEGPAYRGRSATELAGTVAYEQVAELLWDTDGDTAAGPWEPPTGGVTAASQLLAATGRPTDRDAVTRACCVVTALRPLDPFRHELRPGAVASLARGLIATMTLAAAPVTEVPDTVAARLGSGLLGVDRPGAVAAVDAALVLLADHELAASTLAVRVAASARCDPYAAVLAGASVLAGNRHGAASRPLEEALAEMAQGRSVESALAARMSTDGELPGFGHPLYPDGDPRAQRLLDVLAEVVTDGSSRRAVLDVAQRRGLPPPNIDAALAVLTATIGAAPGAGELIFAVARTAGWIAHALEQYAQPELLRPRAVYTGGSQA